MDQLFAWLLQTIAQTVGQTLSYRIIALLIMEPQEKDNFPRTTTENENLSTCSKVTT